MLLLPFAQRECGETNLLWDSLRVFKLQNNVFSIHIIFQQLFVCHCRFYLLNLSSLSQKSISATFPAQASFKTWSWKELKPQPFFKDLKLFYKSILVAIIGCRPFFNGHVLNFFQSSIQSLNLQSGLKNKSIASSRVGLGWTHW